MFLANPGNQQDPNVARSKKDDRGGKKDYHLHFCFAIHAFPQSCEQSFLANGSETGSVMSVNQSSCCTAFATSPICSGAAFRNCSAPLISSDSPFRRCLHMVSCLSTGPNSLNILNLILNFLLNSCPCLRVNR